MSQTFTRADYTGMNKANRFKRFVIDGDAFPSDSTVDHSTQAKIITLVNDLPEGSRYLLTLLMQEQRKVGMKIAQAAQA